MKETTRPNVGARIRALRETRGLSLRALSERSGLSVNAISLIERGENSPTVSSLHMLAGALSTAITDFFREESELVAVQVTENERPTYRKGALTMESLGLGLKNQQLEPFLITVEPGGESDKAVVHPGQEFVYCLDGQAEYSVDGTTYELEPGDSLLLDATRPHSFRNPGEKPVRLLFVFQSMENVSLAGRTHMGVD